MDPLITELIVSGLILGTIAGISPGPLLTLVITESLKHGKKAGIRIALVPMITDLPIVVFSLYILKQLSNYHTVLGILSLAGSIFLLFLVYENITYKHIEGVEKKTGYSSIYKGILANFLSPHPYLFWILIGGSILLRAAERSLSAAILFFVLFYSCLIGSKAIIAWLTHRFSVILQTRGYIYTIRFLGLILFGFSVYFFIAAVNYIF